MFVIVALYEKLQIKNYTSQCDCDTGGCCTNTSTIVFLTHLSQCEVMTTLDDKLLGEKLQYYYSSSEDEESDHEEEENPSKTIRDQEVQDVEIDYSADGSSVNTGTVAIGTLPPHKASHWIT